MRHPELHVISNSIEAASLIAEKLSHLKDSNSVMVIAASTSAVAFGDHLAALLRTAFDIRPCKAISHPANAHRTIGSVSEDEVSITDDIGDIPRDYIYHQIILNRVALETEMKPYPNRPVRSTVEGKTVIVAIRLLATPDAVMATAAGLRKQKAKEIIIAAISARTEAISGLLGTADDVVSLTVEGATDFRDSYSGGGAGYDFDPVGEMVS